MKRHSAVLLLTAMILVIAAGPAQADTVVYRVNAGGPAIAGTPAWKADTTANPAAELNATAIANRTSSSNTTVSLNHPSVPAGTPAGLLQSTRYDPIGRADMQWNIPLAAGVQHRVRLYFAETWAPSQQLFGRVFDVRVEHATVLDNYDVFADVGANTAVVKTFAFTSDGNLDLDFFHGTENPIIQAIEVIRVDDVTPPPPDDDGTAAASPTALSFSNIAPGTTWTLPLTVRNTGTGPLTIDATSITGTGAARFSDSFGDAGNETLAPNATTTIYVTFAPTQGGSSSATLQLAHDGTNAPLSVPLTGTAQEPPPTGAGSWSRGAPAPRDIGEISAGVLGSRIIFLGDTDDDVRVMAYTPATNNWVSNLAQRPAGGNHHAAEVINGELYLFGGNGAGRGRVQIYNAGANSWRFGANIPVASGSAATALISGKVYYAGGEGTQPRAGAIYNVASNAWSTAMAAMPRGVNHAAAATDGQRLWVFGGRGDPPSGGSSASNLVQVYDPATNRWTSSAQAGSGLAPLPVARGGMGKAVYLNGRFYVFGGEDLAGIGGTTPGNVYSRVDIYHPATNTWSSGAPMLTPRHGIFPIAYGGKIYVGLGGTVRYHSSSTVMEIYTPG